MIQESFILASISQSGIWLEYTIYYPQASIAKQKDVHATTAGNDI